MKRLLLLAAAVLGYVGAQAQQFQQSSSALSSTATVLAGTTSNYTANAFFCGKGNGYVGIMTSFKLDAACTGTITFYFQKSIDGTTYETTPSVSATITANGSTAVNTFTQATTLGSGYIRLSSIVNTNATQNLTNLVVKFGSQIR